MPPGYLSRLRGRANGPVELPGQALGIPHGRPRALGIRPRGEIDKLVDLVGQSPEALLELAPGLGERNPPLILTGGPDQVPDPRETDQALFLLGIEPGLPQELQRRLALGPGMGYGQAATVVLSLLGRGILRRRVRLALWVLLLGPRVALHLPEALAARVTQGRDVERCLDGVPTAGGRLGDAPQVRSNASTRV